MSLTSLRPLDTKCPVCATVFKQPVRLQGGGTFKIYCSTRCSSLNWARGNHGKRKAIVLKYESEPENKARKARRQRERQLAKYGLTSIDFQSMLDRQLNKCLSCATYLTEKTAKVDHDHSTGQIRGLLCNRCNLLLGLVTDDRSHLYQLAAYVELDRSKPVIYLIGSLRNPKLPFIGNAIRDAGFECVDNWFAAGKIADDSWQKYSKIRGRTYKEALCSREAVHVFNFDKAYINLSDAVVLVYPAGKSTSLEFGYAVGCGKPGFILMEKSITRYEVMNQFSVAIVHNTKALISELNAKLRLSS